MGLTSVAVCGEVPVAAIVPVVLAGAYRHYEYRGTTAVFVALFRRFFALNLNSSFQTKLSLQVS